MLLPLWPRAGGRLLAAFGREYVHFPQLFRVQCNNRPARPAMSAFTDFLHGLLYTGSVVRRGAPERAGAGREEGRGVRGRAHARHALGVAGPPLAFDAEAALWSATFAWWACWLLVNRQGPPEAVARHLPSRPAPREDAQHL